MVPRGRSPRLREHADRRADGGRQDDIINALGAVITSSRKLVSLEDTPELRLGGRLEPVWTSLGNSWGNLDRFVAP